MYTFTTSANQMESQYRSGLIKACQWLSVASHLLFELSIEVALCDDKKEKQGASLSLDAYHIETVALTQNPYAEELSELANKLRDKLEIIVAINNLDPFEIESWHMLDIFDEELPDKNNKLNYHDLVRFCYKLLSSIQTQILLIADPALNMIRDSAGKKSNSGGATYVKSFHLLLDSADDFKAARQSFVIARYLAKVEGRIV